MRKPLALLLSCVLVWCGLTLAVSGAGAQQASKTTPAPEDTPAPVAGEIGLAGARCPDIARYLNVRSAIAPSLSPDGTRVAFRSSITGQPQLWVASTQGDLTPQQITFGEIVTFHDWSPDGKWIAYGTDRGGNEREGFYLISPDGTREQELLAPSESFRNWGGWSRDGRKVAYAATEPGGDDFSIYTINLNAEIIRPLRVYAGRGGTYVQSWRPDGGGLILTKARGEDANDVFFLNLETGDAEPLFQPQTAARYASFTWTPDGQGFYMASDEDRDFAALAFYDMKTRRLRWIETPRGDVERVALSSDGRYLAWTTNVEGLSELYLRDLRGDSTVQLSVKTSATASKAETRAGNLPRGVVNNLEWASDAPRLAVQLSAPQTPGDIWVFDAALPQKPLPQKQSVALPRRSSARVAGKSVASTRAAGKSAAGKDVAGTGVALPDVRDALTRVTGSTLAGLDAQQFVAPEAVSFPSHDGEMIHGLLYLPRRAAGADAATRAPVVLSVHGGPNSQARPAFNPVHQYLLARGYAVLDLNFRGSTGYGKRFARLDNGRLRPNAVKDMAAAVDWLARSGRAVDATRVGVMGGSYGGYMTLAALAQLPGKFRAGVSFVGVSNWVTALAGASPELKASDRIEYGNVEDPADREFFRELSPLTHVSQVRAPLLISHGANDPRDPVTEADQMVRAIRERGGDVEYLRFPDEGHGIRKLSNRIIAYRRVARFLERTLGRGTIDCTDETK